MLYLCRCFKSTAKPHMWTIKNGHVEHLQRQKLKASILTVCVQRHLAIFGFLVFMIRLRERNVCASNAQINLFFVKSDFAQHSREPLKQGDQIGRIFA
jgi:hypothetical protein